MLILMTPFQQIRKLLALILSTALLAACGVATAMPTASTPIVASLTASVTPTDTELPPTPSPTLSPTSPVPTLTPSAISISAPDGLHMAYINDGNLYFQNGSKSPLQLTHSGKDWNILFFSENGEKIFFLRGATHPFDMYSINTDGSEEQPLITNNILQKVDASYNETTGFHSVTIVPGTHYLLLSTNERQENNNVVWNGDLLVVDTDTAKIKKLPNYASAFYISPDGKSIALDKIGAIDVIDLEGNIIRNNLLTYTPSEPSFLAPSIFWMPDSTELIILLPPRTYFEVGYIPDYTVWRYAMADGNGEPILLDPLPMDVNMAKISPDGNWIIYNNDDQFAFYIGELRTGNTQLYLPKTFASHHPRSWNLDNEHFIYGAPPGRTLYLGSVDGSPQLIGEGDFLGWIDSSRFFYYDYYDKDIVMGNINGSKDIIFADQEGFQNPTIFTFIMP